MPTSGPTADGPDAPTHLRRILLCAVALGLTGDLLFRHAAPALNLTFAVTALVVVAGYLNRLDGHPRRVPDGWMIAAVAFATAYSLLDGFILALDTFAIGALIAGASLRRVGPARTLPLLAFPFAVIRTLLTTAAAPFTLGGTALRWVADAPPDRSRRGLHVAIGVGIAVPIVLVFGALFAEADPAFNAAARALIDWDLRAIFRDLLLVVVGTVGAAGALLSWSGGPVSNRLSFLGAERADDASRESQPSLDPLTLTIVLGALTAVFTSFIALQFRYLFGGAEVVHQVTGLTVAEYARHGFFQVVMATALVIPLLLAVDQLSRPAEPARVRGVRALARLQLVLTALVLASAVGRMSLYVQSFGLTEDRLISMMIMLWLAAVLVWYWLTVLAGRRERFAFGCVVAAFASLALLNLSVPDALIVKENLRRAVERAQPLDVAHTARGLGADATPYLVAHLGELPDSTRAVLVEALKARRAKSDDPVTGRSFNLARWRAAEALATLSAAR